MPAPDKFDGYSYRNGLPLAVVLAVAFLFLWIFLKTGWPLQ